jgi:hypothetical protein
MTTEAFDNATVQPGGPREAPGGEAFFNVEGSDNGDFASYGVADFVFEVPAAPIASINSATLILTQANAFFTNNGSFNVSLDVSSSLASIEPGNSPLAFDNADPGTATDVSEGDLSLIGLGTFNFVEVSSGTVDEYVLSLSTAAQEALVNRLEGDETIRLVLGTDNDATVAATWAGFANDEILGPQLSIDYSPVPEPSSVFLLLLAIVAAPLALRRHFRREA